MRESTRVVSIAAASLAAGALSACAVCGLPEGSLATLSYSGESCETTGVTLELVPGAAYEYVELLVGPLANGEVRVERLYPDPDGGTVTLALDPDLAGAELSIGARGYEGLSAAGFGTASVIVEAGRILSAAVAMERCAVVGTTECVDGVLTWCDGGVTRITKCAIGCDDAGDLCRIPEGDGTACGAACGSCPSGCMCYGPDPSC